MVVSAVSDFSLSCPLSFDIIEVALAESLASICQSGTDTY